MRVFFHGDRANQEGFGSVVETIDNKDGFSVERKVKMDDGRVFWVSGNSFSDKYEGNGLTRWVTAEAYEKWRQEQLQRLRKEGGHA